MNRKATGNSGEDAAERYLRNLGYNILMRNYRTRLGEIDIVACENSITWAGTEKTIVFVEVKTRRNLAYGLPGEAVTYSKQRKIIATAQCYLNMIKQPETFCRFDVLEVYVSPAGGLHYHHIKDAFGN